MIRVVLPFHLRNLARVDGEVQLEIAGPVTVRSALDALEARYPVLQGTIRDHGTMKRRPFVRFFCVQRRLVIGTRGDTLAGSRRERRRTVPDRRSDGRRISL